MKNQFRIRVAGITFIDKKLLLITHVKKNKEYWVIPGGRVKFSEPSAEALIREFKEELDLEIEIREFLFYNEALPPSYPVHTLNLFFLVKSISKNITLEKGSIIGQYELFNKNQINNILLYPKINSILYKGFNKWLKKIT